MTIEVREVKSRADLRTFIYLPAKIHAGHTNWVPPIYDDEFGFFNPNKNKSFQYCDTILYVAYKDKKAVGRIMGIIHKKYNERYNENNARFSFIETYEDPEIFDALIKTIEKWAIEKGCDKIVGPYGFSDKDPQGFMFEGFSEPIVISSNGNYSYMNDMIKNAGYEKDVDMVVYKVPVTEKLPEYYETIYKRAITNGKNLIIKEFKTRKELKPWIKPILHLLNETFEGLYGFIAFEEHEMNAYANRYIYLLDPEFIKIIANSEKEPIGFIISMPDISQGIIKAKGKLLPFGFFKMKASQKKTKQLTLLLGGIKEKYRGQGLDVIIGKLVMQSALNRGLKYIDGHLQLENNTKMRQEMERLGGVVYKRYRVYGKKLR